MSRILAVAVMTLASVAVSPVQAMDDQVSVNTGDLKWGNAPPVLPKGAKIAVLNGDPFKPGPYTLRLMVPPNYKLAPHWHSQAENLTIISGEFYLGAGDKMDAKSAKGLKAGGYHYLPAKMHHYAMTRITTVVQVSGEGPFDINYIDPKDNPAKQQ